MKSLPGVACETATIRTVRIDHRQWHGHVVVAAGDIVDMRIEPAGLYLSVNGALYPSGPCPRPPKEPATWRRRLRFIRRWIREQVRRELNV
jgi:hypothetical protein